MNPYVELGLVALLPVIAASVIFLLQTKTPFGKSNYWLQQVLIGLLFGGLAILGTERGVPINGAQINCRDAAVLIAGLMFGGPSGILAGIIGGVERWIAVAWGVGAFTRVACSVSTIIAGLYAAALRKFMFENKKPGWMLSFAIGIVMEVFHLTMVFITNINQPDTAMAVVKACTFPMILANGISVLLASFFLSALWDRRKEKKNNGVRISQIIQRWMLITVTLAFLVTSFFVFRLQTEIAKTQTEKTLKVAVDETKADVEDASDANLLAITHTIAGQLKGHDDLVALAKQYDVAEISLIGKDGRIYHSNVPEYAEMQFDMHSGEQAAEFLCLLEEQNEFVQTYQPQTSDSNTWRKYAGVKSTTGFIRVGYDAEQFQRDIAKEISTVTKNRHIGEKGYLFVLDSDHNPVRLPENLTTGDIQKAVSSIKDPGPDKTFLITIKGESCYSRYIEAEGFYIVAVLPESEAMQLRNIAVYVNTYMEILVFAILFALIYMLIKRVVVDQIKKINNSLARITEGDLGVVVDVRSNEEFASLSDDINSTVNTLKHYIDEASARIDKELEFAKSIQASALPTNFPQRKDFDIYASMNPAKEVGGDFYDFYQTGKDKLHFLVADVSGKGIPAAMFMMRAKTELKNHTEMGLLPCDVFTQSNAALCEGNDAGMFVTAWQGGLDLETGLVQFANAGHNPPLIRHKDGKFEYLKSRAGFVLAGMDGLNYKPGEVQLEPGDIIYLYTDGVTEATNAQNELYGEERLLNIANAKEYESMEEFCKAVKSDVDAFVGDAPQFDDITMVAVKFIGRPPIPQIHFDEAKLDDIPVVTEFVEEELNKLDCPMKIMIQFNVAIDEIYSNIVRYGYADHPGPVTMKVVVSEEQDLVHLRFEDEGIPYNPLTKEDPDITLSAEERGIGGLGIYMVKKTMDNVRYKYENNKNILTITKKLR